MLFYSLKETYGRVFSLKMGSYKFVMASTPEAVKEILVQRSADYAGRPQTYFSLELTLGRLMVYHFKVDSYAKAIIQFLWLPPYPHFLYLMC